MGIQVTELTKGKACYEKEFIDFEFAGRHISEFGLVAVADGGRHSFDAAPTFQDETSSVNGVDGQYYWGTHFGSKKMSFTLATDGMTEAQVNAFKQHFKPGKYGKFIEDKLACRYGYARISSITTFNTVPFKIRKIIAGKEIYVNEYKGDCKITFEFDDPKMYATEKIIENLDQYGLRALYVNGTPHVESFKTDNSKQFCFYGEKNRALSRDEGIITPGKNYKFLTYYNPSTYQTKPIITMNFTPQYEKNNSFPKFLTEIADEINSNQKEQPYNEILTTSSLPLLKQGNALNFSLPNQETSEYPYSFRYTTPNIVFQINKSISIAFNFYETNSTGQVLELEEKLRLEITNSKVMAWAASALSIIKLKNTFYNQETGNFLTGTVEVIGYGDLQWHEYFNLFMLQLLAKNETPTKYHLDGANRGKWTSASYTITFNSQENRTYMTYCYNRILTPESLEEISVSEENCGDMILSEYLNLDGGDILNEDGSIASCHHMKFTKNGNLIEVKNLSLEYVPTYF